MTITNITSWGHSTVALERGGNALVIDPGVLAAPTVLDGASAVLVTHEHADHIALPRVVEALEADASLQAWAPTAVVAQLIEANADSARVHAVGPGDTFEAAGFEVSVIGGDHAPIHPAFPHTDNNAYLIDGFALHPGDSLAAAPESADVELLFLPISAPWLPTLGAAIDYIHATAPKLVLPVHDAILSDAGKMLTDQMVTAGARGIEYRRPAVGEPFAFTSA